MAKNNKDEIGVVFDFTVTTAAMDARTLDAYYKLRRRAILAGDASLDPDGKTMTSHEIEQALGVGIETLGVEGQCCG